MKIVLVTSPHVRHPAVLERDFQVDPSVMLTFIPIGLLSLISAVRSSLQIEPELFDLNRRVLDGTVPLGPNFYRDSAIAICASSPQLVGFMTENESYHHVLQIAREIKKIDATCKVALGGPHASAVAKATLKSQNHIDYIVRGEGEETFPELVKHCQEGDLTPVSGVWQRSTTCDVVFGGDRPLIKNLDTLPYPAYECYRPDPEEEIFFEVGRGCPFQCTFCSTAPFWSRAHRVKSATRILEELFHVIQLYGCRRMHFTHDLFTTNNAWVREVCHALLDAGAPVRWTCSSRTDTVDAELLELMAAAGCSAIYFGLESGSSRILREIKKQINVQHSFDILARCRRAGIMPNVGFIGGFPTEDEESLTETFDAFTRALEMGCSPVHMFQFTPFDDSSLIGQLEERICTGHFLDLPLGDAIDLENRNLVASDSSLFGAYHRPRRRRNGISEDLIDGLEEFPTLVSATLLPTIALARLTGGMFVLFKRWITWISRVNDDRGAQPFRRCFGSPALFANFLIEEGNSVEGYPSALLDLLLVVRTNHQVASREQGRLATTMANYRTGLVADTWTTIELSTPLALGDIVDHLKLNQDIEAILAAKPPDPVPDSGPSPMYLLWQRVAPGRIQLLRVDPFTYYAALRLQASPKRAGDLLKTWIEEEPELSREGDFFALLERLEEAERLGIFHRASVRQSEYVRPRTSGGLR